MTRDFPPNLLEEITHKMSFLPDNFADALLEFMGDLIASLPFVGELSQPISTILGCRNQIPVTDPQSLTESFLELAIIAWLQPIPANQNGLRYNALMRIPNILWNPIIALFAGWASDHILVFLTSLLGESAALLVGIGGITAGLSVSVINLIVFTGKTLAFALSWRVLSTLLPKLVEVFITNSLCIAIYTAAVGGAEDKIIWLIFALVITLTFFDWLVGVLRRFVVGHS